MVGQINHPQFPVDELHWKTTPEICYQCGVRGTGMEQNESDHPDFGRDEWQLFNEHFAIFPWAKISDDAVGFEFCSASGLSASLVAQRVAQVHCIEADPHLRARSLRALRNIKGCIHHSTLDDIADGSMDFGYCLAWPEADPSRQLQLCATKLKPGAPFLTYFCYALDNRPRWFRALWKGSDLVRQGISRQPSQVRRILSTAVAAGAYWPMARLSGGLEVFGLDVESIPLSTYRRARFHTMREGAQERFAASEQARFTQIQARELLSTAGLQSITISQSPPYWTAIGHRR